MTKTVTPYKSTKTGKKEQVASMFDNISGTYDFLNHFLSLGIDVRWRRKAIGLLKPANPKSILDVATGTGDFALEAVRILKPEQVIGVDISEGMLSIAREKIKKRGMEAQIQVLSGDSENLPFDNDTFDAVTVAFGARNFENLHKGISEICRVLKPGGKVVVLEFSNPKRFPVKQLYRFYFHTILPSIGRLFSKDNRAYQYLPESVDQFPEGASFIKIMNNAGFATAKVYPQAFGICSIYIATK